jgi:hypothetical protein
MWQSLRGTLNRKRRRGDHTTHAIGPAKSIFDTGFLLSRSLTKMRQREMKCVRNKSCQKQVVSEMT